MCACMHAYACMHVAMCWSAADVDMPCAVILDPTHTHHGFALDPDDAMWQASTVASADPGLWNRNV